MDLPLAGRVAVVTGGGRGIGRSEALSLARHGAAVVVNDVSTDGASTAATVVAEIRAFGSAVADTSDISQWDGARALVDAAISTFGRLDIVVNNAGILRDRMLVNMQEQEWDDVMRVHLKGTFGVSRHAAAHWRERSKSGDVAGGRLINTSSASGLYGQAGQSNYGAAKAGIAAFTLIAAEELARYGVTANAIAPMALTPMTEGLRPRSEEEKRLMSADNVAPIVSWLAGPDASDVTGRIFNVKGNRVSVAEGWVAGQEIDREERWTYTDLGAAIPDLVAKARGRSGMDGSALIPAT